MKFRCVDCGTKWTEKEIVNPFLCRCGGLLDVMQDLEALDGERLRELFQARLSERITPYASGVWRYKELIAPELPLEALVTRFEGNTALFRAASGLEQSVGVRKLWFKAQSGNPSGSFKDNGMTAAVSYGKAMGYTRFTCFHRQYGILPGDVCGGSRRRGARFFARSFGSAE
ncbi:hypothetical protein O9H85_06220 [Paenibacillus filicis]|uniref:Tryptophan synthase beta chain-like PALP domain-containing protein n=1 Tax=Paenibacillus gyeongsangnamensis TaxID=3388067 RepID=A0ABT4Q582_9BACL|nr:hypothetical protein [Paenibacillus filicis]MCZ8512027.1 hypothetical protein [Paenibacillus filicis]